MTHRSPAAVALVVLLASQCAGQTRRPDFSGQWSMDHSRSESAMQGEPIGPMTVSIVQSEAELQMTVSRDGKTGTVTYRFDGKPSPIPNGTATSRWEGTTLVTESVRTIQGQTVTTKESRRLNSDGNEMLVDTVLVVQHGYTLAGTQNYGAGKDVFVRLARP